MGVFAGISLIFISILVGYLYNYYIEISKPLPVPKLDFDQYWGPGSKTTYKEDKSIVPFKINYSEKVIADLKSRLTRPLWIHNQLEGVGFEYGFNGEYLHKVIDYWKDDYLKRWTQREEFLNKFPQFTTQIQGLKVHFLHVVPTASQKAQKKVLPLLLLHGWPGSVREFYELIPKLITANDQSDYVFEVIAPSLPGYGWSQGAAKTGFGTAQISIVLGNLMLRLGHQKFLVQGGDWGSIIGSHVATFFQDNVIGYHSNMCQGGGTLGNLKWLVASLKPSWFVEKHQESFHFPISEKFMYIMEETGYMHIQATKPDTIGTALSTNPVGLAAYILEKFSTWTNPSYKKLTDGGLTKSFTFDALLDNVMIYYLTNSITTSQRIYAEQFTKLQMGLQLERVAIDVPVACARFKHDLMHSMDCQLKDKYRNLVQSTYHDDGGHFAAFEIPDVLYDDFVKFVNKALTKV